MKSCVVDIDTKQIKEHQNLYFKLNKKKFLIRNHKEMLRFVNDCLYFRNLVILNQKELYWCVTNLKHYDTKNRITK